MREQFHFAPDPLVDLGLFCYELDPHWEARQNLDEKVMIGSTGGPWTKLLTGEQFATLKEQTWKNDLPECTGESVDPRVREGVGLQSLVARTLGLYLPKELRESMGKGTVSLGAVVLDESILHCTPVLRVMRKSD
jgi:hypothetical protein